MSRVIEKISGLFRACDWFASPVLLRYQGQQSNKTKTGGLISLILIIGLVSMFSSSWMDVLKKSDIKSQSQIIRQTTPSPYLVNNTNFVMAVGLPGINMLNNTNKFFDIHFTIQKNVNGAEVQHIPINVEKCEIEHFNQFNINYEQIYTKYGLHNFLCLPRDFTLMMQGKFVSEVFYLLAIKVVNCTSNCASNQDFEDYINTYGGLQLKYYIINTLINPTQSQPLTEYFQDKYSHMINGQFSVDTNLYISQYEIETDESLWPISDIQITKGIYIDRSAKEEFIHSVQDGTLARFYVRKSDQKLKIVRSYRKLDDMFSYLGGLFGLLAAAFGFVITHYNKCCFQLEMSNKIFKKEEDPDKESQDEEDLTALREAVHCNKGALLKSKNQQNHGANFNFWTYFKYLFSKIVFLIVSPGRWPTMQSINQKIQETQNQMNIDIVLQKISFCEKAFQCLFDQNQMTLLLLQEKISIEELKKQRLIMNMQDERFLIKNNKQKIQQLKTAHKLNLKQTENSKVNIEEQDEVMVSIFQAISIVEKKAKRGDQVSIKILQGLRADVEQKYEAYKKKYKSLLNPQRPSMISRFSHRNSRQMTKMLFNEVKINQINLLSPKLNLSKMEVDKVKSNLSLETIHFLQTPTSRS